MDREAADNTAKTTTTPSNNKNRNEGTTADPVSKVYCNHRIDH